MSHNIKTAVVLAGGLGTRMLPITEYLPKACVTIHGTKLIDLVLTKLKVNKIESTYVTYGHLGGKLMSELSTNQYISGFINTTGKPNGHFITNQLISDLQTPLLVTPSDLAYRVNLNKVYIDYINAGRPAIMIVGMTRTPEMDCDGLQINPTTNRVEKIQRKIESTIGASGIQIITPAKVNKIINNQSLDFYDIWQKVIKEKQLYVSTEFATDWEAYDTIQSITEQYSSIYTR